MKPQYIEQFFDSSAQSLHVGEFDLDGTIAASRKRRRHRVAMAAGFGLGCAMAAVTVAVNGLTLGSQTPGESATSAGKAIPDGQPVAPLSMDEPCANAKPTTLASLSELASIDTRAPADSVPHVLLPDAKLAGAPVTGAMLCAGSATSPAVIVGSNTWVFYEKGYPVEGRTQWLHGLAAQNGGEVTSINGLEAYVVPSPEKGVRSQIMLMMPNTDEIIRIQAPDNVDPAVLMKVASAFTVPGVGPSR